MTVFDTTSLIERLRDPALVIGVAFANTISGSQTADGGLTKSKDKNTDDQHQPIREQSQPQPEHARRRILVSSMR
jgi:hypothetical protein